MFQPRLMPLDVTGGGNSTPAAPTAAQAAAAPPPAGGGANPASSATEPASVTLTAAQFAELNETKARLQTLESEQRARDEAARAEQIRVLTAKGEVENALKLQREQAEQQLNSERSMRQASEERSKRYAIDAELSRALASQRLVPGGAEQLAQLWRSQIVVEPHGDSYAVRTPQFASVTDFVAAQLAQPHYAHFLLAAGGGGTAHSGSSGANSTPTPSANQTPPPPPATLGEAVILHMQALAKKGESKDPRMNLSQPFGLRRASS